MGAMFSFMISFKVLMISSECMSSRVELGDLSTCWLDFFHGIVVTEYTFWFHSWLKFDHTVCLQTSSG